MKIYIKILLFVGLLIGTGCQPDQVRWSDNAAKPKPSPGQVVFEALVKNVNYHGDCLPERAVILGDQKAHIISKIDELFNTVVDPDGAENVASVRQFIKNEANEKKILLAADVIEKFSEKMNKNNVESMRKISLANNAALEKFVVRLIHDEEFDFLIQEIFFSPLLKIEDAAQLAAKVGPIFKRSLDNIDVLELMQKIVDTLDESGDAKKIALKILKLLKKFLSDPRLKMAAEKLNSITIKLAPHVTIKEKIEWLKQLEGRSLELFDHKGALIICLWANSIFEFQKLPASLTKFLDLVLADEGSHESLMSNIKVLGAAGVLNDIMEIMNTLDETNYVGLMDKQRAQLIQDLRVDQLDSQAIKQALIIMKKLFARERPISEAPVAVVGKVVLQLLASSKQNECQVPAEAAPIADLLEGWLKQVLIFVRDPHNGLLPILKTLRHNL